MILTSFVIILCTPFFASSLVDLGAQVQKLIRTNLERELGRPLVRVGEGNRGKGTPSKRTEGEVAIVHGGEIVPHEPEPDKVRTETFTSAMMGFSPACPLDFY